MFSPKNHLRVKPHFSIVAHSQDHVELRSGVWNPTSYVFSDESKKGYLFSIIKGLDGQKSPAELAGQFNIPRSQVESLIDHLQQAGVLETGSDNIYDLYLNQVSPLFKYSGAENSDEAVFITGDPEFFVPLKNMLASTLKNEIICDDKNELQKLESSNENWLHDGLLCQEMISQFEHYRNRFVIFIQKTPNPILTSKWNRIARELQINWIHAAIDGPFLFIGPTFHRETPCYDCFETRIMMNLREYASYQRYKFALVEKQVTKNSFPLDPAVKNLLISHVALESMNYLLTRCNFTTGKVLSIYLPTMEIVFNEVLRHSACQTCGTHVLRDGHQLYFDIHTLLED